MQRLEFVIHASVPGVNFKQLCQRAGISRKTGYKWRQRHGASAFADLADQSRRPKRSPQRCPDHVVEVVIAQHRIEPTWGGRKLRQRLQALAQTQVPAASTCTEILRRAQLFGPRSTAPAKPWQRFEREYPNELWQMDFKGHFGTQSGARCHPFTVLDDHSRFNLALMSCPNETGSTVQAALALTFAEYGLPEALLCDNGPPWGCSEPVCPYTSLTVWLLRLGLRVLHGRPYHPQTQGKEERFHRTLNQELISRHTWSDLAHCAREFPPYRVRYNCTRPHDSLAGATPATRYRPSPRSLPPTLPVFEYSAHDVVKHVRTEGNIRFGKQAWYVGRAFAGLPVGLRPSAQADGQWQVFFCHQQLGSLDLTTPPPPIHTARSIYLKPQS